MDAIIGIFDHVLKFDALNSSVKMACTGIRVKLKIVLYPCTF